MTQPSKKYSGVKTFFYYLIAIPISIGILILILSSMLYLTQLVVDYFGFQYELSEGVKTATVTICGVLGAAIFAFYGVKSQNDSAEKRHRTDKDLDLRKDICLNVAEAYATYFKILLHTALPGSDNKNLRSLVECEKAFFKLHMVCSEQTICKMLAANEEWAKALFSIKMYLKENSNPDVTQNIIYAMEQSIPFLRKVTEFNTAARVDLESSFKSDNEYIKIVMESFERIPDFLRTIKSGG